MKKISLFLFLFSCLVCIKTTAQDTVFINGKPKIYKNGVNTTDEQSPLIKDDYLVEFSYGYPFVPIREAAFFG